MKPDRKAVLLVNLPAETGAAPNMSLQWTHGNVTHFARRKMRAIAARH
jgi:hypothetical protein